MLQLLHPDGYVSLNICKIIARFEVLLTVKVDLGLLIALPGQPSV